MLPSGDGVYIKNGIVIQKESNLTNIQGILALKEIDLKYNQAILEKSSMSIYMSSVNDTNSKSKCIDGVYGNSNYCQNFVDIDTNPWLYLDTGAVTFDEVNITNRDSDRGRIDLFKIDIYSNGALEYVYSFLDKGTSQYSYSFGALEGLVLLVDGYLDSYPSVNDCYSTTLTGRCNLRSAYHACVNLIQVIPSVIF